MKALIVKIGNSQGVRIPKPFLQQSGISDEVDLEVNGSEIIIRSLRRPREGWEDSFRRMAAKGDDRLLDEESFPTPSRFDQEEWQW
ncbi:MAG TPA: AbrB/MazE/SpoVT family DNA-binding domain-containing protein [Blastocatellia bacterium]|nr:AbrB/MazE/SpoVT family DNA-binding domain-containing protein [Blastocatellia bacterium]